MINFLAIIGAITVVACVFFATAFVLRSFVLRGKFLPGLTPLFECLIPPCDLYEKKFFLPIDTDRIENTYNARFRHRYAGLYQLLLETPGTIEFEPGKFQFRGKPDPDFGMEIDAKFFIDGKLIYSNSYNHTKFSDYGWIANMHMLVSSFKIFQYSVPEDMPSDISIDCEIKVRFLNDKFQKIHRKGALSLQKISEN